MKSKLFVTSAICLFATPAIAFAEASEIPAVDEAVVVGTRTSERADRVGQQITVISAEQLASLQTPVLTDILSRTPGVSFSRNGGLGTSTQVYIRGAEPGQAVVLIDGVKLNDPSSTDTSVNFGHLLLGDVERVEVLRGPQSVLWGSQAIGGVVNLISTTPQAPFEANVAAEGGTEDWAYRRAGIGGTSERVSWRATAAYLMTSGISAFDEAKGGREADGYRNAGASAKATVAVTDRFSFDLRGVYSHGRTELDGLAPPSGIFGDTRALGVTDELVGYGGANLSLLDGRFANRFSYVYTRTERKNLNPDQRVTEVTFRAMGRTERFEYQGAFQFTPAWTTVFGVESERSRMRSASPTATQPNPRPIRRSAGIDGVYAQLRGDVAPGLTVSGGIRHDEHDDFGGHTVGQTSAAWRLNEGKTILRASWGEAFKAPSLFQLGSEYGNPDLAPETSHSWDAGVEHRPFAGRVVLTAAYFERQTTNQIDFFSCPRINSDPRCAGPAGSGRLGYYANTARTKATGVELSAQADLSQALSIAANYTFTDARNRTPGARFDLRLPRRPARTGYLEATYRWPVSLTTTVAVRYAGDRFDDAANATQLKGYALWDLRASYPVSPQVELYGRVENLFDESYETIRNYGAFGRTALAGVGGRF